MKFTINEKHSDALYDGTTQLFGTGPSPYTYVVDSLNCIPVDENVYRFTTGLDKEDIESNQFLSYEEKAAFLKELPAVQKAIKNRFGEKALSGVNNTFWKSRNTLVINNNPFSKIFDTDANIEDLILLWQIRGGGFQTVAPSLDCAVMSTKGFRFYLSSVEERTERATIEKFGDKRKAFANLTDLLEKSNRDGLVWITWKLSTDADQLKGYGKKTSNQTYENILTEYIEGMYTKNQFGKKQAAERFAKAYFEFKTIPDRFIVHATLLAAYHIGKITFANGRYYYNDGNLELSSDLEMAVDIVMKPENTEYYKDISASVEKKLNQ